jgi:NADH:ubiquinone oxidoreductase subunit 3 (subunit A)
MGFYTPVVLVVAALVWAFTKDLNRVIALLVIAFVYVWRRGALEWK